MRRASCVWRWNGAYVQVSSVRVTNPDPEVRSNPSVRPDLRIWNLHWPRPPRWQTPASYPTKNTVIRYYTDQFLMLLVVMIDICCWSQTHTQAVCTKPKDFKTLQQMVRQIIAGHQKASFVCEIKFMILITALDCIPRRDFVVAINGELRWRACICTGCSEVQRSNISQH